MPVSNTAVTIRCWRSSDSIPEVTNMLHRAYKPLADAGMRFLASHQDEAMTLKRISKGMCFIAECQGAIVGTINYQQPGLADGTPWYERSDVAYFGQFAVEPSLQRSGIGGMLLDHVEHTAIEDHVRELAFDTSENASHLIEYYARRGFRFVEYVRWNDVNYRSVVMSKTLAASHAD